MRLDEKKILFHETDIIDHLTVAVRRGKTLDRDAACALLRRHAALDPALAAALSAEDGFAPETLSDEALFELLIRARTALAERIFPPAEQPPRQVGRAGNRDSSPRRRPPDDRR